MIDQRRSSYRYANDDGLFVTSWLTAGPHRFQLRALAKDRSVATKTVVADVESTDHVESSSF